MQVNKVQATQPSFGTRLKMDCETMECFRLSGKHFTNFVKELENNGRNDTLIITTASDQLSCNVLLEEIKPAKNKNGFDSYKYSIIENFRLWDSSDKHTDKAIIRKIKEAYDKCNENLSKTPFWHKRIGRNTKYLI